ncbi:MAG: hypothetical protein WBC07_07135 [Methylotenera sp.]
MKLLILILSTLLLTAGCATDTTVNNIETWTKGCQEYQAQNEWWKARRSCQRAALHKDYRFSPNATLWYEYGRTSGAICDFSEATKGLKRALALDQENNGPVFQTYIELARLHYDQGKYQDAVAYFKLGKAAIPEQAAVNGDPIGYAEILEEYAIALKHSNDVASAEKLTIQAKGLREANPNKKSNTDRTPYGKYCDQKS